MSRKSGDVILEFAPRGTFNKLSLAENYQHSQKLIQWVHSVTIAHYYYRNSILEDSN